jgi:hypothetical protein
MKTNIAVGLLTVALAVTAQANVIQVFGPGGSVPDYFKDHEIPLALTASSSQSGIIQDVNVWLDIGGRDGAMWNGDLWVYLTHGVTSVDLLNRVGQVNPSDPGYNDNGFKILLDDSVLSEIHTYGDRADNSAVTGTWNPDGGLLSTFNGMDAAGNWTLTLFDKASGNLSQVNEWRLDITTREVPDASMGGLFSYVLLFGGLLIGAAKRRG